MFQIRNLYALDREIKSQIPVCLYQTGICTQSRGRTGTALRPQVFETSASTDSAIWAFKNGGLIRSKAGCKCI